MRSRYHESRPGGSFGFSGLFSPQPKSETAIVMSATAKPVVPGLETLTPDDAAARQLYVMAMGLAAGLAEDAAELAREAQGIVEHGRGGDMRGAPQSMAMAFGRELRAALEAVNAALDACDPEAAAKRELEAEAD